MDKEEARIANVHGTDEVPEVDEESLRKYRKHLLRYLDKSTVLTGRKTSLGKKGTSSDVQMRKNIKD